MIHAAQLAVGGRLTRARAEQVFAADALMTETLADECLRHSRRLIDTGGCFDWGDHGEAWITEETPRTPSPMGVGHARQAAYLERRHSRDGLDVVRLSPGFVYGPGGLFASAFVDQARQNRLRCIGSGNNWWSCVHVDDLATAYVAAVTEAAPGSAYPVVDDEPVRLRELTDLTTDALGRERVGTVPPFLISLLLGRTLVSSLTTSFRMDGSRIREDLGWTPKYPPLPGRREQRDRPTRLKVALPARPASSGGSLGVADRRAYRARICCFRWRGAEMRIAIVTVLMSLVLLFLLAGFGPLHYVVIGGAVVVAFVIAKLEARSWQRIRERRQNA